MKRTWLESFLWKIAQGNGMGDGGVPNDWCCIAISQEKSNKADRGYRWIRSATFQNDAFEIWIASQEYENYQLVVDQWDTHMPAWVFRRFAAWYLWRWAWGEWFGLRRWMFYALLHRRVLADRCEFYKR